MSYQMTEAVMTNAPTVRGSERLVLMVLAYHARADGTSSFPSVATISMEAQVGERTVQRSLRALERGGFIMATARIDGGRNLSTVYAVTVRKGDKAVAAVTLFPAERVTPVAETVTQATPEPSPSNRPSVISVKRGTARAGDPTKMPNVRAETRAFVREAVAGWSKARRKPGLERFTDPAAISNLRRAAERAWGAGCSSVDLAAAIARRAPDPKSNPWYLDEWCRAARAERDDSNQRDREIARRREEENRMLATGPDPRIVALAKTRLQQFVDGMRPNGEADHA